MVAMSKKPLKIRLKSKPVKSESIPVESQSNQVEHEFAPYDLIGLKNGGKHTIPKYRCPRIPDFNHSIISGETDNSSTVVYLFSKEEFNNHYGDNGETYNDHLCKITSLRGVTGKSFKVTYSALLLYKGSVNDAIKHFESKNNNIKNNNIKINNVSRKISKQKQIGFINIDKIELDKILDETDGCSNKTKKNKERYAGLRD